MVFVRTWYGIHLHFSGKHVNLRCSTVVLNLHLVFRGLATHLVRKTSLFCGIIVLYVPAPVQPRSPFCACALAVLGRRAVGWARHHEGDGTRGRTRGCAAATVVNNNAFLCCETSKHLSVTSGHTSE